MKLVSIDDVRAWYAGTAEAGYPKTGRPELEELMGHLGATRTDPDFLANILRVPLHLRAVIETLSERGELRDDSLDSIPFYSLCRGLFLPLSGMMPEKAAQIFGLKIDPPPSREERGELLRRFMDRDNGLDRSQKVACLVGDAFEGRRAKMRRESLLRLLQSVAMRTRRELLDRLAVVGDVAVLFAESRAELRGDPPLTAAEMLGVLHLLPDQKRNFQFDLLRSVLARCGKLEAYFLAKLILGAVGLRYESEVLAELIAEPWAGEGVEPEQVSHAMALTDAFHVVRLLEHGGAEGLREIQLQPLVPVRPALAAGSTEGIRAYPVWVERKYDGIRLMLHKTTDPLGSVIAGAYSRNRKDYLELVRGLEPTVRLLGATSTIVDGELYGTILTADGPRPAMVHEVFGALQGEAARPVNLRYAAFDLLYLNGADLTVQPLRERRALLSQLVAPLSQMPTAIPISLAEGQQAQKKEDVNRLYQHFRAQGYEGVITKDLEASYRLGARDPAWLKKKPEVTLDLVLLAAVLAVTSKDKTGLFGSYAIGARNADGSFEDVGDVAGVDQVRDAEIQQRLMSEGLLTGRRIERRGASGARPGFELAPAIVVTVRFSGVVRDPVTAKLSLRDPKLVVLRPDKAPHEADTLQAIEELHLKQQVG